MLLKLILLGNLTAIMYLTTLFAYSFYSHANVTENKYMKKNALAVMT